jgi:hypothetical protein
MHLGGTGMTDGEHPEPDGEPEKLPRRPSRDTEKALGLEVAKLFGLSPRLLVPPASPPAERSTSHDEGATDGGGEDPEPGQGGG